MAGLSYRTLAGIFHSSRLVSVAPSAVVDTQDEFQLFCCGLKPLKENEMAVKLVVIYPRPNDVEAFETVYNRDHVPMAVAKLAGKTKIVATRVLGSPAGELPFHRIAEVYFPSMEALEQCTASEGGKQTIGNAVSISSGGAPVFLVAEEETFLF
jgi:uncharacterized protein (TIGR02118 family)